MVAVGFASMFTVFGVAYSFGNFFESMSEEFGSGRAATSAVFSITAFLYFGLGVLSGPAVDRFGPRRVLLVGAATMGIGLVLTSRIDELWQGYLTYGIGVGIGTTCGYVPMVAVVGGWFERRRATALGLAVAGIGLGTLAANPISAALIDAYGWRDAYLYFGIGSAVVLTACALLAARPPATGSAPLRLGAAVRTPAFAVLYASTFLLSLSLFEVFVYLTPFARDRGTGEVAAALLVSVVGGASVVGRLGLAAVSDRVGRIRTYKWCFAVVAASYLIWLLGGAYPSLVVFAVVFGVGYGGFIALAPAVAAELFGTEGLGGLVGFLYSAAAFGALIGPPLAGFIVDSTGGYRWSIVFAMALAAASAAVLLRLRDPSAAR